MQTYEQPAQLIEKLVSLQKKSYASQDVVRVAVEKVINDQTKAVQDFKDGREQVIGFLIGMVQKELKGTGEINIIRLTLVKKLSK